MFAFRPRRTEEALRDVRKKHPILGTPTHEDLKGLIDRLRDLLDRTPPERIKDLSKRLSVKEVEACFWIVVFDRDGETVEKAATVLRYRPRVSFLPRGWVRLLQGYPHPVLETLLQRFIGVFGTEPLESALGERAWTVSWLAGESVVAGCVDQYVREDAGRGETLDGYLARAGVSVSWGLHRSAWCRLLTHGTRASFLAHPAPRLVAQIEACAQGEADRQAFGRRYLTVCRERGDWSPVVLEWILERFGEPAGPGRAHEHPFWEPVDPEAKERFRRWLMARRVEAFFEGERAEFWREYVEQGWVRDVKEILGGSGFMLDFGRFGVVEFKKIGNAAYIYPKEVFKKYWDKASYRSTPESFKDRRSTLRGSYGYRWKDGRIIHHEGWQYFAKKLIDHHLGIN